MKKIMFSVGEPSGEMLAIEVIKKLKNYKDDELYFFGMGGKNLQSHSFKLIVNSTDLAVIGFIEVFHKWFSLKKALNTFFTLCLETVDWAGKTEKIKI